MKQLLAILAFALMAFAPLGDGQPVKVYVYDFDRHGITLFDTPFEHEYYPDALPQGVFVGEKCIEPTKKQRYARPSIGDTVFVNNIVQPDSGYWAVLKFIEL